MFSSVLSEVVISSANLDQLLNPSLSRTRQHQSYDIGLQQCPNCHASVRKTNVKERTVEHLHKQVLYKIVYYYCDTCHNGWPSLPHGVLPNITCGIDVLGHLAYWHVLKQQSLQTLKSHLLECHGIDRSERTIQRYLERFALLTQDTQIVFDMLVQAYLSSQTKRQGLYDETFFSSRYPEKLCLSLLLLPDVRIIAGIKVTEKRNQDLITEIMTHFMQRFGELDVVTTDLSPLYVQAVKQAYTAATLQFCVFHFFQILERKLVRPLAQQLMELWKERMTRLKKVVKVWYKSTKAFLAGKYQNFLFQFMQRLQWCMAQRRPEKIQAELYALSYELQSLLNIHKNSENKHCQPDMGQQKLVHKIRQLIDILRKWDRYMRSDQELETFIILQQQITKIQNVFQGSDEQQFDQDYQNIMIECLDRPEPVLQELGRYLRKYQDNLSVYLEWGLEKATSLLEQVFQRLKKTCSHNRGGKDKESLERFASLYQFFWNTEPLQLRGERTTDKRSPLTRLEEKTILPIPLDLTQRWWYWLSSLTYQEYRKRVREFTQRRRQEWNHVQERSKPKIPSTLKSLEERAHYRWKHSKTLRLLDDLLHNRPIANNKKPFNQKRFTKLGTTTKLIYNILLLYPQGLSRKKLVELLKQPRTTIYDNLVLLMSLGLVITKKVKKERQGRPVTLFLAKPLPDR